MKLRAIFFVLLLMAALGATAAEPPGQTRKQEETFTDLTPGRGMLDPGNLSMLVQRGDVVG